MLSKVIMIVMAVFFVVGAFDRLFGNRLGMGGEFERAFGLMGPTALSILGMVALAPVISGALAKVIVPLFSVVGADPAMFPGVLLSCEISYSLAAELAEQGEIALFSGLVVGSTMGAIISFTIPVACGLIRKEDQRPFATGILAAYIFDPLACLIGGLLMGIPVKTVLINLIPVIVVALVIVLGLLLIPNVTITAFRWFAKLLLAVVTVGLCAAALKAMVGVELIPGMNPISGGFQTVGTIVLSLAGSLPLLYVLRKLLRKPLEKLGELTGINDTAILSLLIACTSLVPGYSAYSEMNEKGKVVFAAFSASMGCLLGCHLGYTASVDQRVVVPMLVAQICAGIFAMFPATFFAKRLAGQKNAAEAEKTAKNA